MVHLFSAMMESHVYGKDLLKAHLENITMLSIPYTNTSERSIPIG